MEHGVHLPSVLHRMQLSGFPLPTSREGNDVPPFAFSISMKQGRLECIEDNPRLAMRAESIIMPSRMKFMKGLNQCD